MSYNGYPNRDTWVVALWLNNDAGNYRKMLNNKKQLLAMPKDKLLRTLKQNFKIGDPVNWKNVKVTPIKQVIREG
jgi:hypothetical protein